MNSILESFHIRVIVFLKFCYPIVYVRGMGCKSCTCRMWGLSPEMEQLRKEGDKPKTQFETISSYV